MEVSVQSHSSAEVNSHSPSALWFTVPAANMHPVSNVLHMHDHSLHEMQHKQVVHWWMFVSVSVNSSHSTTLSRVHTNIMFLILHLICEPFCLLALYVGGYRSLCGVRPVSVGVRKCPVSIILHLHISVWPFSKYFTSPITKPRTWREISAKQQQEFYMITLSFLPHCELTLSDY